MLVDEAKMLVEQCGGQLIRQIGYRSGMKLASWKLRAEEIRQQLQEILISIYPWHL